MRCSVCLAMRCVLLVLPFLAACTDGLCLSGSCPTPGDGDYTDHVGFTDPHWLPDGHLIVTTGDTSVSFMRHLEVDPTTEATITVVDDGPAKMDLACDTSCIALFSTTGAYPRYRVWSDGAWTAPQRVEAAYQAVATSGDTRLLASMYYGTGNVVLRRIAADGSVDATWTVATDAWQGDVALVLGPDGGALGWHAWDGTSATDPRIEIQLLHPDGTPSGAPLVLPEADGTNQFGTLTGVIDGTYRLAWPWYGYVPVWYVVDPVARTVVVSDIPATTDRSEVKKVLSLDEGALMALWFGNPGLVQLGTDGETVVRTSEVLALDLQRIAGGYRVVGMDDGGIYVGEVGDDLELTAGPTHILAGYDK